MQESQHFFLDTYESVSEDEIPSLLFQLVPGDRIFFSGDLWSGKSTFIRALLRWHFHDEWLIVRSPTYTYYQKYGENIYHFDLYRIDTFEDIFLIGASDILDDPHTICLIEWPEILGTSVIPTKKISLSRENMWARNYRVESQKKP